MNIKHIRKNSFVIQIFIILHEAIILMILVVPTTQELIHLLYYFNVVIVQVFITWVQFNWLLD